MCHNLSYGDKLEMSGIEKPLPTPIMADAEQTSVHDAEECPLRKDVVDNCARARFLVMLMEHYFLQGHINPQEPCRCPMLRCRNKCTDAYALVQHVKQCSKFDEGEAWCPVCDLCMDFPVHNRGHCSWKRDSWAKKGVSLVGSISRKLSLSGRKSPCGTKSTSPFPPPQQPPAYNYGNQQLSPSAAATTYSNPQFPSELPNDTVIKDYPVEMSAASHKPGLLLPGYSIPAPVEDSSYSSLNQDIACQPTAWQPMLSKMCNSSNLTHQPTPYTWLTASPSFGTLSSTEAQPGMSTSTQGLREIISPLSTICETEAQIVPAEKHMPSQPLFANDITSSPVEEGNNERLWPLSPPGSLGATRTWSSSTTLLSDFGSNALTDASITDQHVPSQSTLISSSWLPGIYNPGFSDTPSLKNHLAETVAPLQVLKTTTELMQATSVWQKRQTSSSAATLTDEDISHQDLSIQTPELEGNAPFALAAPVSRAGKGFCQYPGCNYPLGNGVSRRNNYKRHLQRIHNSAQPWPCEHCGRPFSRKDNLLRHERLAHLGVAGPKLVTKVSELDSKPVKRILRTRPRNHLSLQRKHSFEL